MSKHLAQWSLVLALSVPVVALAQTAPAAARSTEPTIDDVYKAADNGRLPDAEAMMAKVLTAHPASAKAHFVHAELLSKEGKLGAAKAELAKAREIAPGLPFAKAESVALLTERVDAAAPSRTVERQSPASSAPSNAADFSSGIGTPAKIGIFMLILAAGVFMFRRISGGPSPAAARNMSAASSPPPTYASWPSGYAPTAPNNGYAPGAPAAAAPASSGLGGALMTGAAMGLGAVAVEEAFRHFSHRGESSNDIVERRYESRPAFDNNLGPDANAGMGGNDFGISDTGSWDDGGAADNSSDW